MRFLHTSDWHLGVSFGGHSLLESQRAFCEWTVERAIEHDVDYLVVAGDIYDRTFPPADAVDLFRSTIRALVDAGIGVVAVSGNHDDPVRIAPYGELTQKSGLYVRGGYAHCGEIIHLEKGSESVAIIPLPFLDPLLAPNELVDPSVPASHRLQNDIIERLLDRARGAVGRHATMVISHCFVAHSTSSESERDVNVGGTGLVQARHFEGFDYVALGHLHKPQRVGGLETMQYSGSPLPYSFSEEHPKSVVLVDYSGSAVHATTQAVNAGRQVATIRATFDELMDPQFELDFDANQKPIVGGAVPQPLRDRFVRAELTNRSPVPRAAHRLSERFPHLVTTDHIGLTHAQDGVGRVEAVVELSASDLIEQFVDSAVGAPLTTRQRELVHDALNAARRELA